MIYYKHILHKKKKNTENPSIIAFVRYLRVSAQCLQQSIEQNAFYRRNTFSFIDLTNRSEKDDTI